VVLPTGDGTALVTTRADLVLVNALAQEIQY
jgi:hypothetical protein